MDRPQITPEQVEVAIREFRAELYHQLKVKGCGTFASRHEILGVLDEEMIEIVDAVHDNDSLSALKKELAQAAVTCVFGMASCNAGHMDW